MSRIVKLAASGIGLAREAQQSRGQPSRAPASSSSTPPPREPYDDPPPDYTSSAESEDDEDDWALDDVQTEIRGKYKGGKIDSKGDSKGASTSDREVYDGRDQATLVNDFTIAHPIPNSSSSRRGRLPCPVILPQRRPQHKDRGFVRAYAPVLADCGIDQATFMDFLDSFDASMKLNPIFQVVNIATTAVGFVPIASAQIASAAVQVSVMVAMRIQGVRQMNGFLDQMNEKLFKPHGLYALIFAYKPESTSSSEATDVNQSINKQLGPTSSIQHFGRNMLPASGKAYKEVDIPEAAELVFPTLDKVPDGDKPAVWKRAGNFVGEYYDRRGTATYSGKNPNSKLSVGPEPQFASRFSDPNHASNNGSIISLVTGGYVNPRELRQSRRERRSERRGRPSRADSRRERRQNRPNGNIRGVIRRTIQQDVLYLMIANIPSQQEQRDFDAKQGKASNQTQYQAPPNQASAYQAPPIQASPYQASPYQESPYQASPYQAPPNQTSPYQAPPYQAPPNQGPPYQGPPYQGPPY
ncbi:MAG: Protein cbp3, mitochondrial [Chaenotheca gracillima]|nr:MAG: Protein cbp3, mitochondrial [Chaenotheca gracillima]